MGHFADCGTYGIRAFLISSVMAELLQFGNEGFHHSTGDLTLTEAFVFGSVAGTLCGVPRVSAYLIDSHLLSWGMVVNIKEQVYYGTEVYAFSFHDVEQTKEIIFGEYVNLSGCKKVV
jgi:hypothetical protein